MNTQSNWPEVSIECRPDLRAAILAMPSSRLLELDIVGFNAEGVSRIEMPVRISMSFDGAAVQGGLVGVLADYAGVSAAACTLPVGWIAATTGFEVNNVAPAVGEKLIAIGRAMFVGRTLGVSRAEVYAVTSDGVSLVCVATTRCKPFELKMLAGNKIK